MPAASPRLEAGQPLGVVGELVGQDFYRYLTREVRVLGAIDLAHAASGEFFQDLIV
jgi:hypothetical protein